MPGKRWSENLRISIHAPREGCDPAGIHLPTSSRFQSTHPVRGATGMVTG